MQILGERNTYCRLPQRETDSNHKFFLPRKRKELTINSAPYNAFCPKLIFRLQSRRTKLWKSSLIIFFFLCSALHDFQFGLYLRKNCTVVNATDVKNQSNMFKILLCMSKWSLKIRPIQAEFRQRLCAEKGKGNGNNDLQQKLSRSPFNNKYQQMFINRTLIPKVSLEKQKNLSFEARTSQSTQFWSSFNFVFLKSYLNVEVSNRLVDWAGTIRNKSTANN